MRKWLIPMVIAVSAATVAVLSCSMFPNGSTAGRGRADAPLAVIWTPHATVKAVNLPPQLPLASGYALEDAFAVNGKGSMGFDQPLGTASPPGEKDRLFVVSKTGIIEVFTDLDGKNGGPKRSTFLDLNPYLRSKNLQLAQQKEWGLLGLAFHPNYKANGYFFITYNLLDSENGRQLAFDRVARFSVSKGDPNKADMTSEVPLITQVDNTPITMAGASPSGTTAISITAWETMATHATSRTMPGGWTAISLPPFTGWMWTASRRIWSPTSTASLPCSSPRAWTRMRKAARTTGSRRTTHSLASPATWDRPSIQRRCGRRYSPTASENPWRFSFDPTTGRLFVADVGRGHLRGNRSGDQGGRLRAGRIGRRQAPARVPQPRQPMRNSWTPCSITAMDPETFRSRGALFIAARGCRS